MINPKYENLQSTQISIEATDAEGNVTFIFAQQGTPLFEAVVAGNYGAVAAYDGGVRESFAPPITNADIQAEVEALYAEKMLNLTVTMADGRVFKATPRFIDNIAKINALAGAGSLPAIPMDSRTSNGVRTVLSVADCA